MHSQHSYILHQFTIKAFNNHGTLINAVVAHYHETAANMQHDNY